MKKKYIEPSVNIVHFENGVFMTGSEETPQTPDLQENEMEQFSINANETPKSYSVPKQADDVFLNKEDSMEENPSNGDTSAPAEQSAAEDAAARAAEEEAARAAEEAEARAAEEEAARAAEEAAAAQAAEEAAAAQAAEEAVTQETGEATE